VCPVPAGPARDLVGAPAGGYNRTMSGPSSHLSSRLPLLPALLAALLSACAGTPELEPVPLPVLASESFARARQAWARGSAADDPELLTALAEARAIDPGWVAPRRMEDDLLVAEHREVEALAGRRLELAEAPGDAGLSYLVARLEGATDGQLFRRTTQLDPVLAWGWHGVAWTLTNGRDYPAAVENQERAIALARDPWERAFFTMALARQLRAARRAPRALERLRGLLSENELDEPDWAAFACDVALFELGILDGSTSKTGYLRGLELIRGDRLNSRDLGRLVSRLQTSLTIADPTGLELELALATHPGPQRERLLRQRWLQRRTTPMGRLLLERDVERGELESIADLLSFRGTFASGWYAEAIRDWLVNLPEQVLAADGLPRDPRLRRVVSAAHQLDTEGVTAETLARFGVALLRAGWFREGLEVADTLAEHDLDRALDLRERAAPLPGTHRPRRPRRSRSPPASPGSTRCSAAGPRSSRRPVGGSADRRTWSRSPSTSWLRRASSTDSWPPWFTPATASRPRRGLPAWAPRGCRCPASPP